MTVRLEYGTWIVVSCYPLYDEAGNQWGAASVVKDVTERKRVEEVLRDVAQWAPAGFFDLARQDRR